MKDRLKSFFPHGATEQVMVDGLIITEGDTGSHPNVKSKTTTKQVVYDENTARVIEVTVDDKPEPELVVRMYNEALGRYR